MAKRTLWVDFHTLDWRHLLCVVCDPVYSTCVCVCMFFYLYVFVRVCACLCVFVWCQFREDGRKLEDLSVREGVFVEG